MVFGAKTIKLQAIRDNGNFWKKMANESEESELSGEENFDDLGHFNLVDIQRNEWADLESWTE